VATIRAYPNGVTLGMNHSHGNPSPLRRDIIRGWSAGAVRRHKQWLYSVETDALSGQGWALTLTLRLCPSDADAWIAVRESWLVRVRAMGAVRWHWVVEWQERGVPHLHAAVYMPQNDARDGRRLIAAWLACAALYEPGWASQTAKRITGPVGWLEYLALHASRGVKHYQRQNKPAGWERTGRLWGHGGTWPLEAPIEATTSLDVYYRFRRLVRSWRVADARAQLVRARTLPEMDAARRRIGHARRMLKCSESGLSRYRGVSEWIPESLTLRMLEAAGGGAASAASAPAGLSSPDRVSATG